MDDKGLRTPFDTFDFFSYIMPGTMLLIGLCVHDRVLFDGNGPCLQLWQAIIPDSKVLLNAYIFPLILFLGIITTYILGHIIAAFSSALLDRIIIGRVNFYPYANLLRLTKTDRELFKKCCDKICLVDFIFANIYVAFCRPKPIILYIAGAIAIITFSLKQIINNIWLRRESRIRIETGTGRSLNVFEIMKGWMIIFFPFYAITWFFRAILLKATFGFIMSILKIKNRLPESFTILFFKQFKKVYDIDLSTTNDVLGTNTFWLAGMYIVRNLPSNAAMAQRAYNFCTLARNLTMVAFLLFWYGIIAHYGYEAFMHYLNVTIAAVTVGQTTVEHRYYIWIIITGTLTGILWIRFYNTYYNHYTKLVLRAFVTPKE